MPVLEGAEATGYLQQQAVDGSLREAVAAARYAIRPIAGRPLARQKYAAENSAQRISASFSPAGLELHGGSWRTAWRLRSVGYGKRQVPVGPGRLEANGNRVELRHLAGVSEWYVNAPAGLEQGFTMSCPPASPRAGQRLRLAIGLEGDLQARVEASKNRRNQAVDLVKADGTPALRYGHLAVTDASGRELPAELGITGGANQSIWLDVDDRGAAWPVTVDPTFTEQAFLKASNAGQGDTFGRAIAISGDTLVVGAPREDSGATGVDGDQNNDSAPDSGAAYVFVRSGSTWTQQAYLKASNTGAGDLFGSSVAISGDTVVVGAYQEASNATGVNSDQTNNSVPGSGAAYVFVRNGTTWTQQAYLKASTPGAPDGFRNLASSFGFSVGVSGDTVIVGAVAENSNATGVNGTFSGLASHSGAAYVFIRAGATWTQQAYLKASNARAFADFGTVAISGDTVVVGSDCESSNATGVNGDQTNNSSSFCYGAAYVFVRNGVAWTQQSYLKASNTNFQSNSLGFGGSVAIFGDTVVVGASGENSNATGVDGDQTNGSATAAGAAYVFARIGTAWSQQAYLKSSNTHSFDHFGASVTVSGDTAVVGAPLDSIDQQSGAAFAFLRTGTTWMPLASLRPSNAANSGFGFSVSMSGDTVAAGALANSDLASLSGAAYLFALNSPPAITPTSVTRLAGTSGSALIATVNDAEDTAGSLVVTVQSANPSNGVTLSIISNSAGNVTATVAAAANASSATFTLRVTDSSGDFAEGTITVTVTHPPAITPTSVTRLQGTSSTAQIASVSDLEDVAGSLVVSVQSANPKNGVTLANIANNAGNVTATVAVAANASSATFTLRVTDSSGDFADGTITVTVTHPPAITPASVTRLQGTSSTAQIASVSDSEDVAGSLAVSVRSANPSNGVTLANIANNAGNVTADVAADCTASNVSFTLRVTDTSTAFTDGILDVIVTPSIPAVSASVAINSLSPANSNLVNVGLAASATGNCSPALQVNVYANEDDETPTSPNTVHSPDARHIAIETLRLRAERVDTGSGRVYLIVVKATNTGGNTGFAVTAVVVPNGQSQASMDAVNAMAASARTFALANNGNPPAGYFVVGDGPVIGPKQ